MKQSINHQLTVIYCFVDNQFKEHPEWTHWRQSNHGAPAFTDAEVVTIALMQGYFGCATLKETYELVATNARAAFPHLCSYKQWLARLHAVSPLIGQLVLRGAPQRAHWMSFYLTDSKPIPLCHPVRHGRVRLLREDGAYFGKTKKGWFFGFKLHAIADDQGRLVGAILTPGNVDDRVPTPALAYGLDGGVCLGDLGYRSQALQDELLAETGLLLLTPASATRERALLSSLRERVETTFSQLWSRFVDRVYSRSWHGLWNTIKLKMLHLNLCLNGVIEA